MCACGVCGACAVIVCSSVRGDAVCAVVPWCVMLPPLYLSRWCPPLLRYLLVLCLPWLVAFPSPRASLGRLLATILPPALLRRSLPFPLLSVGPPSSLVCISPCLACVLVCGLVTFLAYFLVPRVLLLLSFSVL